MSFHCHFFSLDELLFTDIADQFTLPVISKSLVPFQLTLPSRGSQDDALSPVDLGNGNGVVQPLQQTELTWRWVEDRERLRLMQQKIINSWDLGDNVFCRDILRLFRLLLKSLYFSEKIGSYYKRLQLNHLIPLLVILIYMFVGAVLFLWLEGGDGK